MGKYINKDGKVGVLVSVGFGAGWSTWNDNEDFLAMDKKLVEMKLNKAPIEEVEAYCKKVNGEAPYMAGWGNVEVRWMRQGAVFRVSEYDGSESLVSACDDVMEA